MFVYLFMQKPAIYLNELKLHCHFQSIDGICAKIADFKLNPFILFIDSFIHTSTKKIQKKIKIFIHQSTGKNYLLIHCLTWTVY